MRNRENGQDGLFGQTLRLRRGGHDVLGDAEGAVESVAVGAVAAVLSADDFHPVVPWLLAVGVHVVVSTVVIVVIVG